MTSVSDSGDQCERSTQVDSFSYGVVLWEIITKEQTQRGNWRSVRVPEECPAKVEELLQVGFPAPRKCRCQEPFRKEDTRVPS